MTTLLRALAGAAVACAVGTAAADTVHITGLLDGASFTTYCTDVFEYVYVDQTREIVSHQDPTIATVVPESSTAAMVLAGLGVVGFVGRRRLRR